MESKTDYVTEITLLRLYPNFESFWEDDKELHELNVELKIVKNIEQAKEKSKENYNWKIGLAKTALANGWKQPE